MEVEVNHWSQHAVTLSVLMPQDEQLVDLLLTGNNLWNRLEGL